MFKYLIPIADQLVETNVFDRIIRIFEWRKIMGIQDLQTFLENEGVGVDLFRIARNHAGGFRLVLDAEGCLDRLYGGYFSGNHSMNIFSEDAL